MCINNEKMFLKIPEAHGRMISNFCELTAVGAGVVPGMFANVHKGRGWSKKGLVNLTHFLDSPKRIL